MIRIGDKFVYTSRNSIFEISSTPNESSNFFTVYYPATGEYRRYNSARIESECAPYRGAPKTRRKPIITLDLGMPKPVEIDPNTGVIRCGCHVSAPGMNAVKLLSTALKKIRR